MPVAAAPPIPDPVGGDSGTPSATRTWTRAAPIRSIRTPTSWLLSRTSSAPASRTAACSAGASSPVSAIRHTCRVVATEPRGGRDAVEKRHVQVEDDGVGIQLLGELDRLQPVRRRAHDGQLRLPIYQVTEGIAEAAIVVRDQDADPPVGGFPERFRHQLKASLAPVAVQPNPGVAIIGAALDLGSGRRGVDMGPRRSATRGSTRASRGSAAAAGPRQRHDRRSPRRARSATSARATCRRSRQTCERVADLVVRAVGEGCSRSCWAATTPSRSGRSAASRALGAGRSALARCARRPQPAGDLAERQRPRDGARGRARPRRGCVRSAALAAARGRVARLALVGVRSLDAGERELLAELDARCSR